MKIAPDTVVTLQYDLCKDDGEILESSDISGPITFMYGKGALIPGLDRKLAGYETDQEATFTFEPHEAFGTLDSGPTKSMSRSEFPSDARIEAGARFEAGAAGGGQKVVLNVVRVDGDDVEVRMQHPLAGTKITMTVKVLGVRASTAAEKQSGIVQTRPPRPPPPAKRM